ncbi:MAG: DNA cytosine methyltransferase [Gammaproteobacteria bacterium WSBS_2016_MAG_OTU1]
MSKHTLKCVDFFCGGGGMSQGLSRAGIKIIGALDNDPDCRETYEANHKDSKFIQRDITEMRANDLAKELEIKKNDDDLIFVGCSPCQYWSIINGRVDSGRKEKSHASRDLLRHFLRFVKYYKPGFVLVENVRNIRNNEKDSGLLELLTFFGNNGCGI